MIAQLQDWSFGFAGLFWFPMALYAISLMKNIRYTNYHENRKSYPYMNGNVFKVKFKRGLL